MLKLMFFCVLFYMYLTPVKKIHLPTPFSPSPPGVLHAGYCGGRLSSCGIAAWTWRDIHELPTVSSGSSTRGRRFCYAGYLALYHG